MEAALGTVELWIQRPLGTHLWVWAEQEQGTRDSCVLSPRHPGEILGASLQMLKPTVV